MFRLSGELLNQQFFGGTSVEHFKKSYRILLIDKESNEPAGTFALMSFTDNIQYNFDGYPNLQSYSDILVECYKRAKANTPASFEEHLNIARLRIITILPKFRGKGYSHQLFEGAEQIAKKLRYNTMHAYFSSP